MADRAAPGGDLLADQVLERMGGRVARARRSRAPCWLERIASIALIGAPAAAAKVKGASPTVPASIAPALAASRSGAAAGNSNHWICVRQRVERVRRLQHRPRVALLVADAEDGFGVGTCGKGGPED